VQILNSVLYHSRFAHATTGGVGLWVGGLVTGAFVGFGVLGEAVGDMVTGKGVGSSVVTTGF